VRPCTGCSSDPSLTLVDRVCPGRWFALRALFLDIACTLAVFDIEAPAGEKLEPKFHESLARYVMSFGVSAEAGGFTDLLRVCCLCRHPLPFKCVIKPRSAAKLEIVRDVMAALD